MSLIFLIIMFQRYDIAFFFDSLKYQKYCNYDYSNDISQYGYITREMAIKIAKEDTDSSRIAEIECELKEGAIYKTDESDFLLNAFKDLYGEEKFERMKNVTKYWAIDFVTGWDRGCGHYEEHIFIIDYYTGEIFEHS